jgi:hypothetical protein
MEYIEECPRCIEEGLPAVVVMKLDGIYKCACGTIYVLYRLKDGFLLKAVK